MLYEWYQSCRKIVGEPIPIEFYQSLYDTEICVAVPLPFFLTWNLQTLVDEASTLPTVKSNPVPGETKGTYILNIDKLNSLWEGAFSHMQPVVRSSCQYVEFPNLQRQIWG